MERKSESRSSARPVCRFAESLSFFACLAVLLAVPVGSIGYCVHVGQERLQASRACETLALEQAHAARGRATVLSARAVGRLWRLEDDPDAGHWCTAQVDDVQEHLSFIYSGTTGPGRDYVSLDSTYPLGDAPRYAD